MLQSQMINATTQPQTQVWPIVDKLLSFTYANEMGENSEKQSDQNPELSRFTQELTTETNLLPPELVQSILDELAAQDRDKSSLLSSLVDGNYLTNYQAQQIESAGAPSLRFGPYILLDKIGEGGMGQVFKARHEKLNRAVALKFLSQKTVDSKTSVQRFYREVRAAAQLNHPNIVSAFDAGEHKGVHYLVMEFVNGQDFSTLQKEQGKLNVNDAVNFILQAARGLEYAHGKGIIHRDIKPANLLLSSDGAVKILDMGLARMSMGEESQEDLTKSGVVMGTINYMAPEQARQAHQADHRSDIYSLGCTLYKFLTGEQLYKGGSAVSILLAHQSDFIPSLCEKLPEVPKRLDEIFQRMVAKKPDDRFSSMSEVIQHFENIVDSAVANPIESAISDDLDNMSLHEFFTELDRLETTNSNAETAAHAETFTTSKTYLPPPKKNAGTGFLIGGSIAMGLGVIALLTMVVSNLPGPDSVVKDVPKPSPGDRDSEQDLPEPEPATILSSTYRKFSDIDHHVAKCVLQTCDDCIVEFISPAGTPGSVTELEKLPGGITVTSLYTALVPQGREEWRLLSELKELRALKFHAVQVQTTDAMVKGLVEQSWPALRELLLSAQDDPDGLTDESIKSLTKLKKLEELHLYGGRLTDKSAQYLIELPNLKLLSVAPKYGDDFFSAEGYAQLASHPKLEFVDANSGHFTDEKLLALSYSKSLKRLALRHTNVTTDGLRALRNSSINYLTVRGSFGAEEFAIIAENAPQLTTLSVALSSYGGKKLTDSALAEITKLKHLKELALYDCKQVTNDGLMELSKLKNSLQSLTLINLNEESSITEEGVKMLERVCPELKVEYLNVAG